MEISDSGEDCCLLEPAMTFVLWQGSNSSTYTDVQSRRKFISLLEGFPTCRTACFNRGIFYRISAARWLRRHCDHHLLCLPASPHRTLVVSLRGRKKLTPLNNPS